MLHRRLGYPDDELTMTTKTPKTQPDRLKVGKTTMVNASGSLSVKFEHIQLTTAAAAEAGARTRKGKFLHLNSLFVVVSPSLSLTYSFIRCSFKIHCTVCVCFVRFKLSRPIQWTLSNVNQRLQPPLLLHCFRCCVVLYRQAGRQATAHEYTLSSFQEKIPKLLAAAASIVNCGSTERASTFCLFHSLLSSSF